MTKYPEIKTYHKMGDKGRLQPELSIDLAPDKTYYVSEKIDGTNTRMIFIVEQGDCHIDWFIGSREELFTAKDDRIYNPNLDVVDNLLETTKSIADKIFCRPNDFPDGVYTIYSELYGGKLPATKQYTAFKEYAIRVFDIAYMSINKFHELSELPRDQIAIWRQNKGQTFIGTTYLDEICNFLGLTHVPFLDAINGHELPIDIQGTYKFLQSYLKSKAGINYEGGMSEGVVIRSVGRKHIVKLRFEDYERTLGIRGKK